jgi:CheY-like chemotaxis protein
MPNAAPVIVVVDSGSAIRAVFERSVENMDVRLEFFESAADAMHLLEEQKPALMFLDIFIPDKDGLTFLEELRAHPLHGDTPVVVISSKDYAQDRGQARELGALDYMTKPIPMRSIRDAIERQILA